MTRPEIETIREALNWPDDDPAESLAALDSLRAYVEQLEDTPCPMCGYSQNKDEGPEFCPTCGNKFQRPGRPLCTDPFHKDEG